MVESVKNKENTDLIIQKRWKFEPETPRKSRYMQFYCRSKDFIKSGIEKVYRRWWFSKGVILTTDFCLWARLGVLSKGDGSRIIVTYSSSIVETIVVGTLGVHSQTSWFKGPDLTFLTAWNFGSAGLEGSDHTPCASEYDTARTYKYDRKYTESHVWSWRVMTG